MQDELDHIAVEKRIKEVESYFSCLYKQNDWKELKCDSERFFSYCLKELEDGRYPIVIGTEEGIFREGTILVM